MHSIYYYRPQYFTTAMKHVPQNTTQQNSAPTPFKIDGKVSIDFSGNRISPKSADENSIIIWCDAGSMSITESSPGAQGS